MQSPVHDPRMQQILDRAATDAAFRSALLSEPHRAVREALGIEIPASFNLRFVEMGAADDAVIVLPHLVRPAESVSEELDDASLEQVAGGWDAGSSRTASSSWKPDAGWSDPQWKGTW